MRLAIERLGFPRWQWQPPTVGTKDPSPPIALEVAATSAILRDKGIEGQFAPGQTIQFEVT